MGNRKRQHRQFLVVPTLSSPRAEAAVAVLKDHCLHRPEAEEPPAFFIFPAGLPPIPPFSYVREPGSAVDPGQPDAFRKCKLLPPVVDRIQKPPTALPDRQPLLDICSIHEQTSKTL